ncbi:class I glutamine amidotransferase-like protein [Dactylonectria macrodidyma]|uniref:Class I glutamine amidotransferase-like protein n=1 Tax=Dactylonectria macrodidyma TaxID=307937 RepID=A0A9P9ESV0_9HYPO|nr:class I glutamine amidotransferase-like protein [Dactylonectria macrodidyma]
MASPPPLRLAILEADTPQPQTRARYGGYTGVFTALLEAAAQSLSPPRELKELVSITSYDVVNESQSYPVLDDIDAVLITGSRHTSFDNDPWIINLVDFARRAVNSGRVKTVGICFGHQIIGRAVGAQLGKSDKGWEVAVTDVNLTPKGKEIFEMDKMRIHQMHRDILFDFPADAIPLGSNAACSVQAMYRPGSYITVQGHPEFNAEIMTEILFNRHAAGIFSDDMYDDGMKRTPAPHDGVAIARAFLKFMREG